LPNLAQLVNCLAAPTPSASERLKRNNFDLLRLVFASIVCFAHSYDLSDDPGLAWIPTFLSPAVAVKAFFVVSGFLIFMSYERSSSLGSYAKKRIRRVYPAYFTVVALAALFFVFVSRLSPAEYFSLDWFRYLAANLTFMNFVHPTLPGVFDSNHMPHVNGALWTLKVEVMFYLSVPIFAFIFRRFGHLAVIVAVYLASVAYHEYMSGIALRTGSGVYAELAKQLPGQLSYFMAGAFFYYFLPFFEKRAVYFVAPAVAVLAIGHVFALPWLEPLSLAAVVVFLGLFLYVGNFGKFGDFSYGVYILHFPIIQLLLDRQWFTDSPWTFLAAVVSLTGIAAVLMWHLVEKRFLFRSSHYIAATKEKPAAAPEEPLQLRGVGPDHRT
jgi:peptidoglycan/LPS O-acetylase OafA/YrhL